MENVPRQSSKCCWCLQGILRQQSVEKRKEKEKKRKKTNWTVFQFSGPQSRNKNEVLNRCILNMNTG